MPFYKQLGAEINILYGYTLQNIKTTIPIYFILLSNNFISISLGHIYRFGFSFGAFMAGVQFFKI